MKHAFFVTGILILAVFLRVFQSDRVPAGLNQDESAIGYNAYSILKTGKDEHGVSYPLYFKSFNDYKLPVYIYSATVPVALFGTTPFAVRSVSLVAGILSLVLIYLLARRLFDQTIALASMFLLAINPWHMFFSRGAYEVNLAVTYMLAGVYVFIESMHRKKYAQLFLSTICFGLSMYTYNVTRLVAPAVLVLLIVVYRRQLLQLPRALQISQLLAVTAILVPFAYIFFSGGDGFSDQTSQLIVGGESHAEMVEFRSYAGVLFNRFILIPWEYSKNLIAYLSVPFFFINSDPTGTTNVGNYGVLHVFELVTMIVGAIALYVKKTKSVYLMGGWIAVCILITSLSAIVPHPTRSYVLVIPLTIISAIGFVRIAEWLHIPGKILWYGFVCYSILFFMASYFLRFPVVYAEKWRDTEEDVVDYVLEHEQEYDRIIFDRQTPFAYTSFLYYGSYDPKTLHADSLYVPDGLLIRLVRTGKYEFRDVDWETDLLPGTLIISHPDHVAIDQATSVATFTYPERPVVLFVDNQIAQYPTLAISYELYTISQN